MTKRLARKQGGFSLIEVMLAMFVLVLVALMFGAMFPTAQISRVKASYKSYALGLANQKVEELRSAGYSGIMVGDPTDTPLTELPNGTERVTVTQYASNVKKVVVTISWSGYRKVDGPVTLATLVSDHS